MRAHERTIASLALLLLAAACTSDAAAATQAWHASLRDWEQTRTPAAYGAWLAIDERFPEGQEAHRRIREADRLYRDGIARVAAGDPSAREPFEQAVATAPMDPRLYLPLARAFRSQAELAPDNPHLFIRAAEYYRKFLTLVPDDPDHDVARRELEEFDPESTQLAPLDVPAAAPTLPEESGLLSSPLAIATALSVVAVLLALAALAVILTRPGGRSLAELAAKRPELHPAIAYLVSSLRHELLKHRIGAVSSGIDALAEGRASSPQREFVSTRLFGGEPLAVAWEGHVRAFESALGPELDLRRRDRAFRSAARAIQVIGRLEAPLARGDVSASKRLRDAHAELGRLDRELAELVSRMVRTRIDDTLLREILDDVRNEYAASRVSLGPIAIETPHPAPEIEVFRVDLVLVLKNVLRNAILAAGRMEPPGRVKIEVVVELEATGEENVVLRVLDTSPETLTTEAIYERRVDRGLGLVTAALTRYDGAIVVEKAEPPWAKAVALRFFRAFGETEDEASGDEA
jgi:tetratricopeptide (TPR) repeat protein